MVLLAAFQVLLMRYSGQEDIAVGTPIAGRNRTEIEGLIGFFVNTLVMRGDLSGNPTFSELLTRTRERAVDAYSHQDLPFEKLVEELQARRDLSRNPLFQVMFTLQNTREAELRLPGLAFTHLPLPRGTAKFDLTLFLAETDGQLDGSFEFSTDLFDASTDQAGWRGISAAARGQSWPIPHQHIDGLAAAHRRRSGISCWREWNATRWTTRGTSCIQQLFEQQAERHARHHRGGAWGATAHLPRAQRARQPTGPPPDRLGVGRGRWSGFASSARWSWSSGCWGSSRRAGPTCPWIRATPKERLAFMVEDTGATVL